MRLSRSGSGAGSFRGRSATITPTVVRALPLTRAGFGVVVSLLHAMSELDQRAKEVFEAARKLPPQARVAYLDRTCGGDAQLRQRIVEALCQAQEDAAATAQAAPATSPEETITVLFPPEAPGEKPGDWIGRYKLLEPRGEGGMDTVWVSSTIRMLPSVMRPSSARVETA